MRDVRLRHGDEGSAGDVTDDTSARVARVAAAVELADRGISIEERVSGITRLGHLRAARYLVHRATRSSSPRLRAAAAVALGSFGGAADEERLKQLTDDWSAPVRSGACRGLGIGGFTDATKLLLDIAGDADEPRAVRADALLGAARCASSDLAAAVVVAASRLADSSTISPGAYATALGLVDHPSTVTHLEALLERLLAEGGDAMTARIVITSLSSKPVSPRGEVLLVRSLEELPGTRQRVCSILVQHPVERSRPALERLLDDPNDRVVTAGARALFALGAAPSKDRIAALLAHDGWTAHTILGCLRGPVGVELAEHVARRGPAGLRAGACSVVSELDPARARALATELVTDFDPSVRFAAFEVLASGEDAESWAARAAYDPVPWVANSFGWRGAALTES